MAISQKLYYVHNKCGEGIVKQLLLYLGVLQMVRNIGGKWLNSLWNFIIIEILLGIIFIYIAPDLESISLVLSTIIYHFGLALIITSILTLTVDRLAKQEFAKIHKENLNILLIKSKNAIEDISSAQFFSQLKEMMSELIFIQVRENIIKNPFLRQNFIVTFKLEHNQDDPNHINVHTVDEYTVRNIAKSRSTFTATGELEKENVVQNSCKFLKIRMKKGDNVEEYEGEKLNKILSDVGENIIFEIKKELEPNETIHITTSRFRIQFIRDRHHWKTPQMCDGINVKVHHPKDMRVLASVSHPSKNKLDQYLDEETENGWKFEQGMLPYQGITIQWFPK